MQGRIKMVHDVCFVQRGRIIHVPGLCVCVCVCVCVWVSEGQHRSPCHWLVLLPISINILYPRSVLYLYVVKSLSLRYHTIPPHVNHPILFVIILPGMVVSPMMMGLDIFVILHIVGLWIHECTCIPPAWSSCATYFWREISQQQQRILGKEEC